MQKRKKGKKAKKKPPKKGVTSSKKAETLYAGDIKRIIRAMNKDIATVLMPQIRQEKPNYIKDGWSDMLAAYFARLFDQYTGSSFKARVSTILQRPIRMAEESATDQVKRMYKSATQTTEVDRLASEGDADIEEIINSTVARGVGLITNLTNDYASQVQTIVTNGMQEGLHPTAISKQLQEKAKMPIKRANLIARNEVARVNSAVDSARSESLGMKYYRWSTSNDERVTGRPGGLYPNSKVKCWDIAKKDIGYGPGVFTYKKGAPLKGSNKPKGSDGVHPGTAHIGCRCRRIPLIEGVNFELPEKN